MMKRWLWLLLFLVASVASAERITTFAWDNGTNWPVGTTVELCANDLCVPGLTGTQHTMTVPAEPGGVISAKARAVAPDGYQCGNPLVPCLYSGFATLLQTWPKTPINGWATLTEEIIMPVAHVGTVYTNSNNDDTSITIEIPAEANAIIVFGGGYGKPFFNALNFDNSGMDFTLIKEQRWNPDYPLNQIEVYGMLSSSPDWPGTGNKTLYKTWNSEAIEGIPMIIAFFSGVYGWEQAQGRDGGSSAWTANFNDVSVNDMAIVSNYRFLILASVAGNGQTTLADVAVYRNASISAGYKSGASSVVSPALSDNVPIAFLLKSTVPSVSQHISNPIQNYTHILVR